MIEDRWRETCRELSQKDRGKVLNDFENEFLELTGLRPVIGIEIEFFLLSRKSRLPQCSVEILQSYLDAADLCGVVSAEVPDGQFEVSMSPANSLVDAAMKAESIKEVLRSSAQAFECVVSFAARPYRDRPGSGLHIHVSLHDEFGTNMFSGANGAARFSKVMEESVAGLCRGMIASMWCFAPTAESYRRFKWRFDSGPYRFCNAPRFVNWGFDDRTVALRISDSLGNRETRNIEHRVPGADANPATAIAAVVAWMGIGISQHYSLTPEYSSNSEDDRRIVLPTSCENSMSLGF